MADAKTTALTSQTTRVNTDIFAMVNDPSGSPVSKKMELWVASGRWIGSSFPGSPSTGDVCYRTDRHIEYYYDGAQWLSTDLHFQSFNSVLGITVDTTLYIAIPYLGVYGIYLERLDVSMFRTAAGEWDAILLWSSTTNTQTTIVTVDGNGTTTNNWVPGSATIGAVLDANAKVLGLTFDEVSGTSTLFAIATLSYRLIE